MTTLLLYIYFSQILNAVLLLVTEYLYTVILVLLLQKEIRVLLLSLGVTTCTSVVKVLCKCTLLTL